MMSPRPCLTEFLRAEDGAITVDWTVLTASIVGLGLASAAAVRTGVVSLGGDINLSLANSMVASLAEDFVYSPLLLTMDEIDTLIQNLQSYDDATLQGMYGQFVWQANNNIDAGAPQNARIYIDILYAVEQSLTARSLDIPSGAPTVADLVDRYNAATG